MFMCKITLAAIALALISPYLVYYKVKHGRIPFFSEENNSDSIVGVTLNSDQLTA